MKIQRNLAGILAAITFATVPLWQSHAAEEVTDDALASAPVIVDATELVAVLSPTQGNQTAGVVIFRSVGEGKVESPSWILGIGTGAAVR